jgi:hypothetical protein
MFMLSRATLWHQSERVYGFIRDQYSAVRLCEVSLIPPQPHTMLVTLFISCCTELTLTACSVIFPASSVILTVQFACKALDFVQLMPGTQYPDMKCRALQRPKEEGTAENAAPARTRSCPELCVAKIRSGQPTTDLQGVRCAAGRLPVDSLVRATLADNNRHPVHHVRGAGSRRGAASPCSSP